MLQLDRNNISNALTDTITEDLGISKDDVNFGNQLQLIGIILAEIPSNILLQKVGAHFWLTGQILLWGAVALGQAWVTDAPSFYATRLLLGLFEAGYIPGAQYILSLFYKPSELALRTAIFYFGNYFATATGSLIAAGVLHLGGEHGMSGWQWLFMSECFRLLLKLHTDPSFSSVEGALTLSLLPLFCFVLPPSPTRTRPLFGRFDVFTTQDRKIMALRISLERGHDDTGTSMTVKSTIHALLDYRLWMHAALNVVSLAPKGGLQLYGPTVIQSLGFGKINANLLNSVSSFLVIILSFSISLASDKTGWRGLWCIVAFGWSIIFAGSLWGSVESSQWVRYALFTLLSGGNALAQGLNDSWLSINAQSKSNRSIGLALVVMGSNLGGLAGQQLFRSSDAPKYQSAFASILGLYGASIILTVVITGVYWRANKRTTSDVVRCQL